MPATTMATLQQAIGPTTGMSVVGANKASLRITGQFAASLFIEATDDVTGSTGWFKYWGWNYAGKTVNEIGDPHVPMNTNFDYVLYLEVEPFAYIRMNCSVWTGGTGINVTGYVDSGGKTVQVSGSITGVMADVDEDNNLEVTAANTLWVHDYTVPAGKIAYISSGNEMAVGALTIDGTLAIYGTVRCKSVTQAANSTLIMGPGGILEVNPLL